MEKKELSASALFRRLLIVRFECNGKMTPTGYELLDSPEMYEYVMRGTTRIQECLQRMAEMLISKDVLEEPEQKFLCEWLPLQFEYYPSIQKLMEDRLPGVLEIRKHPSWEKVREFYDFSDDEEKSGGE